MTVNFYNDAVLRQPSDNTLFLVVERPIKKFDLKFVPIPRVGEYISLDDKYWHIEKIAHIFSKCEVNIFLRECDSTGHFFGYEY